MADNYLERRMEEYRSGRLATHSKSTPGMRQPRKGCELVLTFPPMNVVVIGRSDTIVTLLADVVSAFTRVGSRVAFTSCDVKRSTALAQSSGARYYPPAFTPESMISDITERWGGSDVIVDLRGIEDPEEGQADASGPDSASVARHILYLSPPDNPWLSGCKP